MWLFSVRLDVDRKKLKVDDPGGMDEEQWAASHFVELMKEEGVVVSDGGKRSQLGASLGS